MFEYEVGQRRQTKAGGFSHNDAHLVLALNLHCFALESDFAITSAFHTFQYYRYNFNEILTIKFLG